MVYKAPVMEKTDPVRLFIDWKKLVVSTCVLSVLFQRQSIAVNVWAGQ